MKSIKPSPMPHFGVLDDGILPFVVEQIFAHAKSAKGLNSLFALIKDRSYYLTIDWSDLAIQVYEEKGFILADKNEQGQGRILSLMDAINMMHSVVDELTFKNVGEADQDTLMHFGFEQFAYMSILDCCVLTALCLLDHTDILLYRDYSEYKEGYVQHFICSEPSDNQDHLLVLNITKTVCSFLVNDEEKLSIANAELFSKKLFEWTEITREAQLLAPVYLKNKDLNCTAKFEEICCLRLQSGADYDLNRLQYLYAQKKALIQQNRYELAASVRMKIKEIENNNI